MALLFLIQSGISGMYFVLTLQHQQEIHHKYFNRFLGDDLILLEIPLTLEQNPNSQFKRKHAKEFQYLGQMYDIVEAEVVGQSTWYLVYPDTKETKLRMKMAKQLEQEQGRSSGKSGETTVYSSLQLYFEDIMICQTAAASYLNKLFLDHYHFSLQEFMATPLSPPPCNC